MYRSYPISHGFLKSWLAAGKAGLKRGNQSDHDAAHSIAMKARERHVYLRQTGFELTNDVVDGLPVECVLIIGQTFSPVFDGCNGLRRNVGSGQAPIGRQIGNGIDESFFEERESLHVAGIQRTPLHAIPNAREVLSCPPK